MSEELQEVSKQLKEKLEKKKLKEALEICEKGLEIAKDDADFLKIKGIILVHLEKYDELLEFVNAVPKVEELIKYEYIYALFIKGKNEKAKESFEKFKEELRQSDEIGAYKLESQINFKLGNFKESAEGYNYLINTLNYNSNSEVFTNYISSLVLSGESSKIINDKRFISEFSTKAENDDIFEYFYNLAFCYSEILELSKATKFLEKAKEICIKSLKTEGYNELEIKNLLTPINVQMGYIFQILGKSKKAIEIYSLILKEKPKGQLISLAVAGNNLVSLFKGSQSTFEAERRMKFAKDEKVQSKLTLLQKRGIWLNSVLLLIQQKKYKECYSMMDDLYKMFKNSRNEEEELFPGLIKSSILYKEKKIDEAVQELLELIQKEFTITSEENNKEEKDKSKFRIICSLAQLYFNKNNQEKAINLLFNSNNIIKYYPAIIGIMIGYFKNEKNIENCKKIFSDAINYWTNKIKNEKKEENNKENEKILIILLNEYANYLISIGDSKTAIKEYEKLLEIDSSNQLYIAKLIMAMSNVNFEATKQYISKLPSINIEKIKASFLEKVPISLIKERKLKSETNEKLNDELIDDGSNIIFKKKEKKKKNKRKNKPPKDLSKEIDPERWIPKYERKAFKKINQHKWQGSSVDTKLEMKKQAKELTEEEKRKKEIEDIIMSVQGGNKNKKSKKSKSKPKKKKGKKKRRR